MTFSGHIGSIVEPVFDSLLNSQNLTHDKGLTNMVWTLFGYFFLGQFFKFGGLVKTQNTGPYLRLQIQQVCRIYISTKFSGSVAPAGLRPHAENTVPDQYKYQLMIAY